MGLTKRTTRSLVYTTACAVVAGGVIGTATSVTDGGGRLLDWYHGRPVARCPEVVELGEASFGDTVTAAFTVGNDGYGPLTLYNVRTGCSCIGLERRIGAGYEAINRLTLAPGENADLAMRFKAVGTPGKPMAVGVQFSTDDPDHSEVAVRVVVAHLRSGLTTVPPNLVFPDIHVGTPYIRRVEVRDANAPPRSMKRVDTVGVPGLECKFVPVDPSRGAADWTDDGVLVGHLDIIVRQDRHGHFSGVIELEAGGDGPAHVTHVLVVGQAEHLMRLAPSAVTLPLQSGTGLRWTTTCLCRVPDADGVVKLTASAPDALDVRATPGAEGGPGRIEITVREEFRNSGPQSYQVSLRAEDGKRAIEAVLPVDVSP
jgi:hypothetical protein